MKKNLYFLILLLSLISCNVFKKGSYNPNSKYGKTKLQEDFSVLDKVLRANHPSLYWYSTKDSIDNIFSATYNSIEDSLTEQQFRKKVAWSISKIHCGHTVVRSSKSYTKYISRAKLKLFPLYLKVWKDSAVVVYTLVRGDSVIRRGTPIISINRVPIKKIVDSMCSFISSDGYSNIFKYQLISFNFPIFYRHVFGIDSSYAIEYLDSIGKKNKTIYKNLEGKVDFLGTKQRFLPGEIPRRKLKMMNLLANRSMEIDTSLNTALISVNTFSKGKLLRFFRHSFKKIRQQNIKNVILDLRLNSGGSVLACTRLSQYLIDKPFKVADTVVAYTRTFYYKKYIKPWLIYWASMHLSGKRYQDNRIHFKYFERHLYKPKKKNHFDGHVYILTGGYTFSAATIVAGNLKGQNNVTIVGEETGGGAYGNSAMLLTSVVLPHTKLRVTLPLYRMVLNSKALKNGRGVIPDVEVSPSSIFIRKSEDAKMEKALEIIKERQKPS